MAEAQREQRFEATVAELEQLIDRIESGQAGLEESLAHYERGMKLVAACRGILDATEKRIAQLSVDEQGRLRVDGEPVGEPAGPA